MIDLKKSENEIEIKNPSSIPAVLFICGFFAVMFMVVIMIGIATDEPIGFIEILVFIVFLVLLVSLAYIDSTMILKVNDNGVMIKSALKSKCILWDDVKDFGISYHFRNRYGFYYCLYFSKEKLIQKNDYSKKLRGKIIKFVFEKDELKKIKDTVIPYCSDRVKNAPFIGKEK